MNVREWLWESARGDNKRALPILSFPAVQKLGITVEQLVKNAEWQAQAMQAIARETDTLAVVSPMDLSVEAEAFGARVHFEADEVPAVIGRLVRDAASSAALPVPSLDVGRAPVFAEGVRLAKERITDRPVLAGIIGPYSLAGRLMDVTEIMYICFDDPDTVHTVLDKATTYLIQYGRILKASGADGLVMAEPLAGILSPDMAEEFSVPYVRRIIDALQDEHFAVIYHNCGGAVSHMLPLLFSQGAAAYHFGNACRMDEILANAPSDVLCMGNIDPVAQFVQGTPQTMTAAVRDLLENCRHYENFVLSSGCDIPSHARWENIYAFFGALREE